MKRIKLIGDSILGYMPKNMINGVEERHAIENAPTELLYKLYPQFKDNLTDVNIFCLGINDYLRQYYDEDFPKMSTEEIIGGLTSFISEIKADNNGQLVVLSLLPIRQTYPWESYFSVVSKEIPIVNSSLKEFCNKQGIHFIDTYSHFVNKNGVMREDLSDDGIHPSQGNGYNVLAGLINSVLEKVCVNEYETTE